MKPYLPLIAAAACFSAPALAVPIVIDDSDGAPGFVETGPMGDAANVTATNSYNGTARSPSIPAGPGAVTGTWTWTGLDDGVYDVALHWAALGAPGNLSDSVPFTIVSGSSTVNGTLDQKVSSIGDYTVNDDADNPFNFETLGQIEVAGSGQISLTLTGGVSPSPPDLEFEYFDAALVNAVPEPGSLALLGLGGLACLRRRRK